jgi:threonyl-tRNA synthetase
VSVLNVSLPDGSVRQLEAGSTIYDVAKSIGPGLAKSAVAGKINGKLVDLDEKVADGCKVEILTDRSAEGVDVIRHSTAHLMAMAIQEVFPGTQITIGPVVENQFYYDVYPKPGTKISANDFAAIEKKMTEIAEKNLPVIKKVVSRKEAVQYFTGLGEKFKVEIVNALPEGEDIKIYGMDNWFDLCRGPHVPSTGKLGCLLARQQR